MLSARKKLNLVILLIFGIWLAVASLIPAQDYLPIPTLTASQSGTFYVGIISSRGNFTISYQCNMTFTATGSFSVNNPVTVVLSVGNANVSNLLGYGGGIMFLHSVNYPLESSNNQYIGVIVLHTVGNGVYQGKGQLVWQQEGQTWGLLAPYGNIYSIPESAFLNSGQPILTISGVSDTLSMIFSESTTKVAWQIGSFSIVFLQPVFEAIFLKEEKRR